MSEGEIKVDDYYLKEVIQTCDSYALSPDKFSPAMHFGIPW